MVTDQEFLAYEKLFDAHTEKEIKEKEKIDKIQSILNDEEIDVNYFFNPKENTNNILILDKILKENGFKFTIVVRDKAVPADDKEILKQSNILFVLDNSNKVNSHLRDTGYLCYVILHYEDITVKNSNIISHYMKELNIIFPFTSDFKIGNPYSFRTSVTYNEFLQSYIFSHSKKGADNITELCLGSSTTDTNKLISTYNLNLKLNDVINVFYVFESYVRWESLEGTPYTYIKRIEEKQDSSFLRLEDSKMQTILKNNVTCFFKTLFNNVLKDDNSKKEFLSTININMDKEVFNNDSVFLTFSNSFNTVISKYIPVLGTLDNHSQFSISTEGNINLQEKIDKKNKDLLRNLPMYHCCKTNKGINYQIYSNVANEEKLIKQVDKFTEKVIKNKISFTLTKIIHERFYK